MQGGRPLFKAHLVSQQGSILMRILYLRLFGKCLIQRFESETV